MAKLNIVIIILSITLIVNCDERWKTCEKTFCKDVRKSPENFPKYNLNFNKVTKEKDGVQIELKSDDENSEVLQLSVTALENDMFRVIIKEYNSIRYRNDEILETLVTKRLSNYNKTLTKILFENGNSKAEIDENPFKIKFYNNDQLVSVINDENRLVYGKINSPIALDVSFPEVTHAYGIPEHADHLALRHTLDNEPYRHFNLDYGSYNVESTEALYGAIGVLYARAPTHTSGVFWYNAAQTWIDVDHHTSAENETDLKAFFMSESGIIELYVLTGPTLAQSVMQYTKLTGTAPLPQYFTLGYHQSKYSYMTSDIVLDVVDHFDEKNLPLDVMWLDIDYTEEMKYFTWDKIRFPNPLDLQNTLKQRQRKLVAIIDPHFKEDDGYDVYKNAKGKYFIRTPDNTTDYIAKCWPGDSAYIDFLNLEARNYYTSLYNNENFKGDSIHFWNDMNEPAVFEALENENTLSHDAKHLNGKLDHRDVHNIYGFFQVKGTWDAMMKNSAKGRPFILTRSHFAGIQRYAAMWTGDNEATWEYLKISFPMCLTEALAGVSFCGADIGGFAKTPSVELNQRWYQAGAWLPFYRGHSNNEQEGREPYNNPREVRAIIRDALQQRYAHLPVWYNVFRHHELTGEPVIRPIIYEYPNETQTAAIDDIILLGKDILVAPVLEQGVKLRTVYFPGGAKETWFQIEKSNSYTMFTGIGAIDIPVNINSVPVFYRGGSIIARKDTPRLTTAAMKNDSYTLYICLNEEKTAYGSIYEDDHTSFQYREIDEYVQVNITFSANSLQLKIIYDDYQSPALIEKAVIINPPENITRVDGNKAIKVKYNKQKTVLTIEKLSLRLNEEFSIQLLTSKSSILELSIVILIAVVIKALLF